MKWLLSLFSVILTVVLLELVLHISGYTPKPIYWSWAVDGRLYTIDSKLIYKQVTSYTNTEQELYTDMKGYKLHGEGENLQEHSKQVAVVGDSFVWGNTAMNFTYPYILQEKLKEQTKQAYKVTNAGMSGYGTDQQYVFIKDNVIPELDPEVIVWNVNLNDVGDDVYRPLFDLKDGSLRPIPGWVHSIYLQGLVSNIIGRTLLKHTLLANLIIYSIEYVKLFQISATPDQAAQWSLQKKSILFKEMKKLCNEKQIQLVFVISPSQRYVEKLEGWEQDDQLLVGIKDVLKDEQVIDLNQVFAAQQDLLAIRSQQDKVLGITTEPETLFLDESILFPRGDWHPSIKGNSVMAESVVRAFFSEKK
jgi:hypothetical protein